MALLKPRPKNWRMDATRDHPNDVTAIDVTADLDGTFDTLVGNTHAEKARDMFIARMGGVNNTFIVRKKDFVQCHVTDDTVHLFYYFGQKVGNVSEPIGLFPSDTLIAQFRLLLSE